MKKDRNCTMNMYPTMMPYGSMVMPGQMVPMPGMMDGEMGSFTQFNYGSGDSNNSLSGQINSLEQRVRRLENLVNGSNYSTNYNSNNYQMM